MDRVPSPRGIVQQHSGGACAWFDGLDTVESTDGSFLQLGQASHLFDLSFLPGDSHTEEPTVESAPLLGRRDIDDAMLEALRRAMVGDDGLSGPVRLTKVREERLDIDAAMLEALRQAAASDPEVRGG